MAQRARFLSSGLPLASGVLVVAAAAAPARAAENDGSARLDTLCPWGRLSDGRGRLVRCLSAEESERLLARAVSGPSPGTAAASAVPSPPPPAPAASPPPPPVAPAPSATPTPPAGAPPAQPAVTAPAAPPFEIELGPVVADVGALPDALKSLRKAQDRFVACVLENGGVSLPKGDVELRFLVQERGRAEGVSVKKSRGLSEAAAKCIASVVDRRFVGYPEAPAVGATLSVSLKKKK